MIDAGVDFINVVKASMKVHRDGIAPALDRHQVLQLYSLVGLPVPAMC